MQSTHQTQTFPDPAQNTPSDRRFSGHRKVEPRNTPPPLRPPPARPQDNKEPLPAPPSRPLRLCNPPLRHLAVNFAPLHLRAPLQPRLPTAAAPTRPPRGRQGGGQGRRGDRRCSGDRGQRRARAPLLKIGCARLPRRRKEARPSGSAPPRRAQGAEPRPGPGAEPSGQPARPPARAPPRGTCTMRARRSESLAMLSPHFLQEARPLLAYSARYSFSAGSAIAAAEPPHAAHPPPRAPRSLPPARGSASRAPSAHCRLNGGPDLPLGDRFGAPGGAWNVPVCYSVSMGGWGAGRRVTWRRGRAARGHPGEAGPGPRRDPSPPVPAAAREGRGRPVGSPARTGVPFPIEGPARS